MKLLFIAGGFLFFCVPPVMLIPSILSQRGWSEAAAQGIGLGIALLWVEAKEPGVPGPTGVANCVCFRHAVGTGQS